MTTIQVYGSGCKNCTTTAERILEVANELGLNVDLEKVTDLQKIMAAGVLSTPALGIEGVIKHSGSVPSVDLVRELLSENVIA
ncbi:MULTISPECIES: thioredoxin family protein [unclassified Agarivorans]|uniref:thioredoxin family protein n=1 Tax=unclassified Agarivorans TaxID=2636026 RepID=UPI0026E301DE|nr:MULTISPECIES: thioredoxin family protein [unclassified Agarivorans]MDO6684067.1 thioredoxin family protein [Agarivorans sp. 3_MG-2023]MDO6714199.1 thioredoxin family protein [Agarivorans sp. 2_MG-2023]